MIGLIALIVAALGLLMNALLAFFVAPVRTLRTKIEGFEAASKAATEKAIADLKLNSDKCIADVRVQAAHDAKMLILERELEIRQQIASLQHDVKDNKERLTTGHDHFRRLDDKDHQIENLVVKELGSIRELIAAQPTKDDLNRLYDEIEKVKGNVNG